MQWTSAYDISCVKKDLYVRYLYSQYFSLFAPSHPNSSQQVYWEFKNTKGNQVPYQNSTD